MTLDGLSKFALINFFILLHAQVAHPARWREEGEFCNMMENAARRRPVERLERLINDPRRNEPIVPGPETAVGRIGVETDRNPVFELDPIAEL